MMDTKNLDNFYQQVKKDYDYYEKRIAKLEEENQKLKDEKWKDNQLQEMKKQLDIAQKDCLRGFPISEDQHEKIKQWIQKHEEEAHSSTLNLPRGGAIGGSYIYSFIPTSIGVFGTIKCSCGKEYTFQEAY